MSFGFYTLYLVFALGGAGLVLALVLRKADLVSGRTSVLLITLAWPAGGLIGWLFGFVSAGEYPAHDIAFYTLAGLIGGAVTFRELRKKDQQSD